MGVGVPVLWRIDLDEGEALINGGGAAAALLGIVGSQALMWLMAWRL